MNHIAVGFGRDERFSAIELDPESLPGFIDDLRAAERVCLNVTSPFKEEIILMLDNLSGDAADARAVNIVIGDSGELSGYNADINGFLAPAKFLGEIKSRNDANGVPPIAMILGSGGAATAMAIGLQRAWGSGRLVFMARDRERLQGKITRLRELFEGSEMEFLAAWSPDDAREMVFRRKQNVKLLLNATPIGQWPDAGSDPFETFGMCDDELNNFDYYYDAVYNPPRTAGMKHMLNAGCANVIGGIDWFCRQAVLSAEMFFGRRPSEDEVRRFVESELKRA